MRVVFMGTPDFAVAALKRLHATHDIAAVYTQPPRPAGRGRQARPSAVQAFADSHGLKVCAPASLKQPAAQQEFAAFKADVAVVAAYGLILPEAVLAAPRRGCLNIHASLLPRWRGAAPIQRAIMAGDTATGITIMQMDAGLDTGPMLLRREVPVTDSTTAGELHDTLAALGGELIVAALAALDTLTPDPQPAAGVTYAAKIDKAETRIVFDRPAREVVRHIHGLSPWPGAWFTHAGERIKVLRAVPAPGGGPAGTVIGDQMGDRLTVACATEAVHLLTLQREGRGVTDAASFLRGYALPKGTKLA